MTKYIKRLKNTRKSIRRSIVGLQEFQLRLIDWRTINIKLKKKKMITIMIMIMMNKRNQFPSLSRLKILQN